MLPNDPVFRLMNYHVRVFVKRYYHLRVFFKIFALALFSTDWTPLSGHNGSTPGGHSPCLQSYSCAWQTCRVIPVQVTFSKPFSFSGAKTVFCVHRGWGDSPYLSSFSPLVILCSYSCEVLPMDKKYSPLSVLLPHNRFRSPTKKDSRYVAYGWHIVSFSAE